MMFCKHLCIRFILYLSGMDICRHMYICQHMLIFDKVQFYWLHFCLQGKLLLFYYYFKNLSINVII